MVGLALRSIVGSSVLAVLFFSSGLVPVVAAEPSYVVAFITSPADDARVVVDEPVSFVSGAYAQSCTIATYSWEFGDGASATTRDAEHTYVALGTYTVTHEVSGCAHRHTVMQTIHVVLAPPTAALVASVNGAEVLLDASASSSTSGTIIGYRFSLDGEAAPEQSGAFLSLSVAQHGHHVASVVVLDDAGGESSPASVEFDTIASLVSIQIDGPTSLAAGASASYSTTGFDDLGDDYPLLVTSIEHVAPTTAGPDVVSYEEEGVIGTLAIEVVAGELASIALTGPATVTVAASAAFTATGADTYGNSVALVDPIVIFTASTTTGPRTVCHSEQGVTGCLEIEVVAGPLVRLFVTGPVRLGVGETGIFGVVGIDAYGNAVTLAVTSFAWTAPSTVGPALACYNEAGVEDCATVDVVLVRVARVALVPTATTINIGRPLALTFTQYDANDNVVDAGAPQCSTNRGTLSDQLVFRAEASGVAVVACSIQGLTASSTIRIVRDLIVTIALDEQVGVALLSSVGNATITARFLDGGAVAGASGVANFAQFGGPLVVHLQSVSFTLDADGNARVVVPLLGRLPGDHRADALVVSGGNSGGDSETYTVTIE